MEYQNQQVRILPDLLTDITVSRGQTMNLPTFYGIPIFIHDWLGIEHHRKQTRFPRSKRKRIREKWRKQERNYKRWTTQTPVSYMMRSGFKESLIMNSAAYDELKKQADHTTAEGKE